ncbi:NAD(P)/FAD-dependent oxidoreductase [Natronolimnohabitans sp. A-GB9]|uniref:NAD(P)/FAD-dependent oxidoreductase n=1 Tax=Natronolimnohabitans sp. A-GB9 TaxID=3069757 RepID=UPI0027B72C6C|nr:NAD(P)/FAD-dependent oxidoreductase [Natronolimnohabitans sp. A-GB9]MDQ2050568.1 NAD(P)/FAD-dependent oxidoreductase [Natronolimnohabitans sp. A-GB9]
MSERSIPTYEVVVIGGGPAGLTTALYTTRLGHRTAVFEKEGGRHTTVDHVHNVLGVSENVSGQELATHAVEQLEHYGGDFYPDAVESVQREGDVGDERRFRLESSHATVTADRIVFATGFRDRSPDVPGLERFTGRGLHYCLHCDAYTLGDGPVFVLGHTESAAHVAMTMCNFTDDVDLLLDGREPEWDDETDTRIRAHPVDRIDTAVVSAYADETIDADEPPWLGGLEFADSVGPNSTGSRTASGDGTERDYLGGFAMYGSVYNADLAADLGCTLRDDGAIAVDENRETSVDGAYAVGDVTHGQNQTTIAIGDGASAGLAIHKDLRPFPKSIADLESRDGDGDDVGDDTRANSDGDGVAGDGLEAPGSDPALRAQMRRVRELKTHPGLRDPSPGRD